MRAISAAVALVALLAARRAAAEDLRLTWKAPAGCPSVERVREAALKSAGRGGLEPLEADARVEQGERWKVTIRSSRNGTAAEERTVEGASCAAVADATAVILAIAMIPPGKDAAASKAKVAPDGAEAPVEPASAEAAAAAPAAANVPSTSTSTSTSEAERAGTGGRNERHGFAGSVGGATDGTTMPAAALGARAGLAWTPGRARVEVVGSFFSAQSKTTATSAAGARFNLLVAGARGCWALVQGPVELSPCVGLDLQTMSAKGFGATQNNYEANGAWMSAAAGGLFRLPLASWFALRADVDAIVPFSRPTFVVEGDGAVHRPSAIGARAGIGAELLFL